MEETLSDILPPDGSVNHADNRSDLKPELTQCQGMKSRVNQQFHNMTSHFCPWLSEKIDPESPNSSTKNVVSIQEIAELDLPRTMMVYIVCISLKNNPGLKRARQKRQLDINGDFIQETLCEKVSSFNVRHRWRIYECNIRVTRYL